jgi:hypothetical protein
MSAAVMKALQSLLATKPERLPCPLIPAVGTAEPLIPMGALLANGPVDHGAAQLHEPVAAILLPADAPEVKGGQQGRGEGQHQNHGFSRAQAGLA